MRSSGRYLLIVAVDARLFFCLKEINTHGEENFIDVTCFFEGGVHLFGALCVPY
jgi:hypothetical protein